MAKRAVEIIWIDSGGQEGRVWDFKDDFTWPRDEHKTVAYILKRKDGYLYIAQSLSKHQYGRVFRIPVKCIVSVRRLKTASKEGKF